MTNKVVINCWGKHNFEGVEFFLEPENIQEEICPFKCKPNMPPCPHLGLNESTAKKWHRVAYVQDETLKANRCLKLIPKGLTIRDEGLVFVHSKFMPSKPRLLKLLEITNALPLFIYGIDINTDLEKLLVLAELRMPRPIYFSGDPYIPFPAEYKRI